MVILRCLTSPHIQLGRLGHFKGPPKKRLFENIDKEIHQQIG